MRRVVITGLGPVAPNGIGIGAFWEALMAGRSGIKRVVGFDASSLPCQIAGEVGGFDAERFMDARKARRMARFAQLAVAAAALAVEDARLETSRGSARRGVCLGVSNNAVDLLEREIEAFLKRGGRRGNPTVPGAVFPHAAAAEVAIRCACEGPTSTTSAGCAAGALAITQACEEIRDGRADVMIAGGADGSVTPFAMASFCAAHMLPATNGEDPGSVSRPFDGERSGGVLSEGAGVVVLEELQHALARHVPIYGEVLAWGSNAESHQSVYELAQDETYLGRSMRLALASAGLRPTDVDYISAHAPSDPADAYETRAIKAVFGEHAYSLAISSIKSMIGNPLAAAGPLQAISAAMALREQRVPPTVNYHTPDPDCDLDYVPNRARVCRVDVALVNAHGLGGANCCIALGRHRGNGR